MLRYDEEEEELGGGEEKECVSTSHSNRTVVHLLPAQVVTNRLILLKCIL